MGCMLWVCRWGSGAVSCGVGCWCQVGLGLVEESSSMVLLNGMGVLEGWVGGCLDRGGGVEEVKALLDPRRSAGVSGGGGE